VVVTVVVAVFSGGGRCFAWTIVAEQVADETEDDEEEEVDADAADAADADAEVAAFALADVDAAMLGASMPPAVLLRFVVVDIVVWFRTLCSII